MYVIHSSRHVSEFTEGCSGGVHSFVKKVHQFLLLYFEETKVLR